MTAGPQGQYIVGSQTLSPGGARITVSGTVYSLSPSGTALQVGTSILPLATPAPVITIASQPATMNADANYVIGTQTLKPGGPPITVAGTVYSLPPSGPVLQPGPSTIPLTAPGHPITLGKQTITPNAEGDYIIDSQTLRPAGAQITVSGTTYSLSPSGTALVADGSSHPLPVSEPAITLPGGQVLTANAAGDYVFSTQTLRPGGHPVTVSGTVVSMASDGQAVVVGGSTEAIVSTSASNRGIGELIWSGVGGGGGGGGGNKTGPAQTDTVQFTGKAAMGRVNGAWTMWTITTSLMLVGLVVW